MRKRLAIIIPILIILIFSTILYINKSNNKDLIKLEPKYYKEAALLTIDKDELLKLEKSKESFIVYTSTEGICACSIPFDPIIEKFIKKHDLTFYFFEFRNKKGTTIDKYITHSPSVIIYKDGKVVEYLKYDSDDHIKYYESLEGFETWFKSYVNLSNK